jgi:precorrin-2/cobalt-factor-2 C20-methyltransferase
MNKTNKGTLYGIGVGPGDPDLIPMKSVNILKKVDLIFAASSTKNSESRAVNIARPYIPDLTRVKILPFPMTKDENEKMASWQKNTQTILSDIESGKNAAFLTLGDPLTYATYGYVLKYIKELAPDIPLITIPGITSFQAAASRVNLPLVEGEESLLLISGVEGGTFIRKLSQHVDNIVILKAYKNIQDISDALAENDLIEGSIGIRNCGMENEEIIQDVRNLVNNPPGYWTLVISKKKIP